MGSDRKGSKLHLTRALVALLLIVVGLAGCGGDSTKAGGSGRPVTLTIGTDDPRGRPASDQIEQFARRVEDLSGGALRVDPVWDADGPGFEEWDQRVARMVVDGRLDLA